MDLEVKANVKKVTVFVDRASVTLQGEFKFTSGSHQVFFDGLPIYIDRESARTRGKASSPIRLMGVDIKPIYFEKAPSAKLIALEEQIESLGDELRIVEDDLNIREAHASYIAGLRMATEQFAKGLSRGKTTVEDQEKLAIFLNEQDSDNKESLRDLGIQKREMVLKVEKLRKEREELISSSPKKRFRATVGLEAESDGEAVLELTYLVSNAGWKPLYDFRLQDEDESVGLNLTTIAEITQNTGQDWRGVDLFVSTARPALTQRKPEINPWYLDVIRPQPIPSPKMGGGLMRAAAQPAAEAPATVTAHVGGLNVEADFAATEVEQTGATVTYRIPGLTDVPSDGSSHKKVISVSDLDLKIDYLTIPKHTDAVFRRVTAINDSPSPLLAGKANLFALEEYIGSTKIDYIPASGELEILFGVEERITIKRELSRRDVDKVLLRDKRQLKYGYKIELENLMSERIMLELKDQLPVSRHEEIKIRLDKSVPEPEEISDLNILEWKLELDPGEKKEIDFGFTVEHPRNLDVYGLDWR